EAGHRRYTTPHKLTSVVHHVANILEDERIERLMCQEFAGLRWLIRKLSGVLYDEAKPVEESSSSPGEVVGYFLQLRWAKRMGQPIKGSLSPHNRELWEKVEPLVYQSWQAENSDIVDRNAQEIVRILGLKEPDIPQWVKDILDKLGTVEGRRDDGDEAEQPSGGASSDKNGEGDGGEEPESSMGMFPPTIEGWAKVARLSNPNLTSSWRRG
ncbi:MAG: hypothetical protein HY669_03930, partial [Chloroflexi bacterium]|nr:hypothetical protein [Chloroflexota bacterium]